MATKPSDTSCNIAATLCFSLGQTSSFYCAGHAIDTNIE